MKDSPEIGEKLLPMSWAICSLSGLGSKNLFLW